MGNGTAIGKVRGLGSAHEGSHHWWHQRLTAGANLLLMLWLLFSLALLPAHDQATFTAWLSETVAAVPMILLVAATAYHFRLGLQVVIEDYVHDESGVVLIVLINLFSIAVATLAIFSILKIAFTSGAA